MRMLQNTITMKCLCLIPLHLPPKAASFSSSSSSSSSSSVLIFSNCSISAWSWKRKRAHHYKLIPSSVPDHHQEAESTGMTIAAKINVEEEEEEDEKAVCDAKLDFPIYLEELIERFIYGCRFLTIFGVVGSLMGSIICFLKGCVYVLNSFAEHSVRGGKVILMVVEAIDVYLIGTVMLVFGMGLYELFISNLDNAKTSSHGSNLLGLFKLSERPKWLEIQSVDELKTKLGHVIVMVLLIGLFEKSKKVTISSTKDLFCFAASILLSSSGLYLLSKLRSSKHSKPA